MKKLKQSLLVDVEPCPVKTPEKTEELDTTEETDSVTPPSEEPVSPFDFYITPTPTLTPTCEETEAEFTVDVEPCPVKTP